MKDSIFVIIPTFNEAIEVLRGTVMNVLEYGYEVVVVDDGSSEDLSGHLSDLPIHYICHPINLGQGASLQTGMDYALKKGVGILVHFDADGQHNASDIGVFVETLISKNADIVLGSRFLSPADKKAVPPLKRFVLKIACLVNGVFTGLWLTDAHNGFRVMSRKGAERIRITENKMAHATEILHHIRSNKLKYCEMPTHIVYTEYSLSKGQSAINSLNILIDLIKNRVL